MIRKKIPFGRIIRSKVRNLIRVFNYLHDSNSNFRPTGIISDLIRTAMPFSCGSWAVCPNQKPVRHPFARARCGWCCCSPRSAEHGELRRTRSTMATATKDLNETGLKGKARTTQRAKKLISKLERDIIHTGGGCPMTEGTVGIRLSDRVQGRRLALALWAPPKLGMGPLFRSQWAPLGAWEGPFSKRGVLEMGPFSRCGLFKIRKSFQTPNE